MLGRILFFLLALTGLAAIVAVGAYFVLKRPDIPYETLIARYETSQSHYVDLPSGVRLHYREEGNPDGQPIIFLHGFASSSHTWTGLIERLGSDYRILAIDFPGHGLTRAPAGYQASIESLRDALDEFVRGQELTRFALIGSSMGGNVAWEYTLTRPERVDTLVLIGSGGWPPLEPSEDEPLVFKLLANPTARGLLRDIDNTSLIRDGLEASFADPALATDEMVARYSELSRAPGHRDIILQLSAGFGARNFATPERLAPITAPTLIIQGGQDRLIQPANGEAFRDAIAGSELIMMENVGHLPQEEAADDTANAIRTFLAANRQDMRAAAQ